MVLLGKHEGFTITVSTGGRFEAVKGDVIFSSKNYDDLRETINKHLKQKRAFKPVEAIDISGCNLAKITSRDVNDPNVFWITHYYRDAKSERGKRFLFNRWRKNESFYVKRTPENIKVLESIWAVKDDIKKLEKKINDLTQEFTDPIFPTDFGSGEIDE